MIRRMQISRRRFIQSSTAVGASALAFPYFVPGSARGANDRIAIGQIGTGGRGMSHVRDGIRRSDTVTALCDVDSTRLGNAVKALDRVGQKPFTCKDYRQLLERKDVDAVIIATPDHWHALQMIDACAAGKDVYSEKPTCRTIQEGQAMINATHYYKRIVQIGAQGRSMRATRAAAQFVRNGQIGKVDRVEVWHPRNRRGVMVEDSDPPPNLDWDLWLGPARWRPYNASLHPGAFRWVMDMGGGFIRDRGNHVLSCVYWTMNADATGPVSVEATGQRDSRGIYDVPVTMDAKWEFKNPDWTLTWSQPGKQRPFPGKPGRIVDWGAEFFGPKDSLILWHGDGADTEQRALDYVPPEDGVKLPASPGHRENWLQCIKTREMPIMPVESGVSVVTLCIIANIAFLLGRKLNWDPAKRQFIADDEANRFLADPYRYPWQL
jgi:predicted dehydrogenase